MVSGRREPANFRYNPDRRLMKGLYMKTLVFINEKGGTGKSSLATHFAAGLAIIGRTVILVDTDPQGHATSAVGLDKRPAFYDLCVRDAAWKDVSQFVHPDVYSPREKQAAGKLYCVASNHEVYSTAANMKRQNVIRQRFAQMEGRADYIIVDTSPTPSTLHEAIVAACDGAFVPTECEAFSALEGLPDTLSHTGNVREIGLQHGHDVAQIMGILPNKYDHKSAIHNEVLALLQEQYGDLVWDAIPFSRTFGQAQMRRQFLYALYPKHAITRQLWQAIHRLEVVCHA